jgi:L-glutamine-phosphate cytidylyltransferase
MDNRNIKVILLVAGEGKRLRPYTLDRPKCMVEIEGISLIDRQLAVLNSEGIDNIVLIGGYKSEMLKEYSFKLRNNPRFFETNMLWTLFCAEDELDGEVIISYGDIIYSRKILQALLESTEDIAVTIDKDWESYWQARNDNPLGDAETLKLRKDGTISEIGQKPKALSEIEGQYMGLMKFSSKGLRQMKEIFHKALRDESILGGSVENAYMTDMLQAVIDSDQLISAVLVHDEWVEVDTVSDLELKETIMRVKSIESQLKV